MPYNKQIQDFVVDFASECLNSEADIVAATQWIITELSGVWPKGRSLAEVRKAYRGDPSYAIDLGVLTAAEFQNEIFESDRFSEIRERIRKDVSVVEAFSRLVRNGTICAFAATHLATIEFKLVSGSTTSHLQPQIQFDLPSISTSPSDSFRLATTPTSGGGAQSVLDRTTFKHLLSSFLGPSSTRERIVDEMFGCMRAGLSLATFGLLGLLSETVWLAEASRLAPHSTPILNVLSGAVTQISSVQTAVSAELAGSPKPFVRSEGARLAVHADFLRRIRNYALHGQSGSPVLDSELEVSSVSLAILTAPVLFEALHDVVSKRITEQGGTP
jgi:hypothetical protein